MARPASPTTAPAKGVPGAVHGARVAPSATARGARCTSAPADGTVLPRMVRELAVRVANAPVRPTTGALKAAVADVVSGTTWSGYRAGRQRLASLGAVYLNWFLPSAAHTPTTLTTQDGPVLRYDAPDGTWFVDELVVGGYEGDVAGRISGHLAVDDATFAGVRVVTLSDPASAVFVTADGTTVPLAEAAVAG